MAAATAANRMMSAVSKRLTRTPTRLLRCGPIMPIAPRSYHVVAVQVQGLPKRQNTNSGLCRFRQVGLSRLSDWEDHRYTVPFTPATSGSTPRESHRLYTPSRVLLFAREAHRRGVLFQGRCKAVSVEYNIRRLFCEIKWCFVSCHKNLTVARTSAKRHRWRANREKPGLRIPDVVPKVSTVALLMASCATMIVLLHTQGKSM